MKDLLIVFVALLLIGCGRDAAPTSYYFPNGFKGEFVIVYGKKNGCPKKYENGSRQLYIPDNGVLVTQFEFSEGFRNDKFYLQNEQGKYEKIKKFIPDKLSSTGWKVDTTKETTQKDIRSIRGSVIEAMYYTNNDYFLVECGAFVDEEELNALNVAEYPLSDSVFRQVKADNLIINCK